MSYEIGGGIALVLPHILRDWHVSIGGTRGGLGPATGVATEEFKVEEYTGDGFSVCVERDRQSRFIVSFDGLASFSVNQADRTIVCHPLAKQLPEATLEHLLLDQIVPRILGQQGGLVLHAAGLGHEGAVILLLGDTGRGKSTLATSLYTQGMDLLGDDAMNINLEDDRPLARAVYPSLRLLPDSRTSLLPAETVHHPIGSQTRKERITLPFMALPQQSYQPIAGIFILENALPDTAIALRQLNPAELCMALTSNSFALDPADNRAASNRLQIAASLARQAPAYALHYARDYALLPRVRAAIVDSLSPVR